MSAAQRLFTEGLISYHRTDSTTLSERALGEAAGAIRGLYGEQFYSGPRQYRTTVKNAQEAHEAIRPTNFGQPPSAVQRLGPDEQRLYDLVWKRAVASQMADARVLRTSLEITADGPDGPAVFTASGKAIQFAGFLRAYVEGSDDPAAELGDQETVLPKLSVGDLVTADGPLALESLHPLGHETVPPARYTDASLVKRLEDDGIGRPSTYASIISTIERRGYVWRQGKALVPSFTAYAVTRLLKEHFAALVELGFTGLIEEGLDEISKGERDRNEFLAEFYDGGGARAWPGLKQLVENQEQIDYPVIALGEQADGEAPVVVRIGRFGPYVQVGEGDEAKTASIPDDTPPADFTLERAVELVEARAKGPDQLGTDPDTGLPIYLMTGRFGPYVQLGETPERGSTEKPRRASLTKDDDPGLHHRGASPSAARAAAARRPRPRVGRGDRLELRPLRPVREARRRLPFAGRRRRGVHRHPRPGRGAVPAGEAVAPRRKPPGPSRARGAPGLRSAHPPARGPLRSVRDRWHDERLPAQGPGRRCGDARRRGRPAARPRGRQAARTRAADHVGAQRIATGRHEAHGRRRAR